MAVIVTFLKPDSSMPVNTKPPSLSSTAPAALLLSSNVMSSGQIATGFSL